MTIHITPEPECSYVSFESNIPLKSYSEVIQRVVNTFKPGRFIFTLFANRVNFQYFLKTVEHSYSGRLKTRRSKTGPVQNPDANFPISCMIDCPQSGLKLVSRNLVPLA